MRIFRIAGALIIFTLLTFYFLDFAGILPAQIRILGQIQFISALFSHNIAIIIFLTILALLFGRVYCSFICPMGIFQDIIIRCSGGRKSKKNFVYGKNNPILRWSIVAVCVAIFFSGYAVAIELLDPYGAYGRIAVHIFKPGYMLANNALAYIFNHFGNYTFYRTEIAVLSFFSLCIAVLTFVVIGITAWVKGRLYCNTICPVGTILGFINKLAFFKIRIDGGKCASCGICEKKCKASCINAKAKTVDYSRCVNCFSCINSCSRKGIYYSSR